MIGGGTRGTLNISDGTFQVVAGSITVGSSSGEPGEVIQTGGTVTCTGLVFGRSWNSSGTYNLNGGVLRVPSIGITPSGGYGTDTFNFGGGTLQASGAFSAGIAMALTGIGGNANVDTAGYAVAIGGLSGAGGLNKLGGGTLTLSDASTYSGNTTISGGTLLLGNANALQGSTLDYNGYGGTLNFGIQVTAVLGGLRGSQNLLLTNAGFGDVTVELCVGGNGQSTVYSGRLSGPGSLDKQGGGVLTLTGTNSYTGTTTVGGAPFVAATTAALPGYNLFGNVIVQSGAAVGGRVGGSGWTEANFDTLRTNATWAATGGALAIDTTNGSYTYAGNLTNPSGAAMGLTVLGPNTLTLKGANTYSGLTTVNGGTLELGVNARNPVLTLGGGADILSGKLVFDYTGSSNLSTIQAVVMSGVIFRPSANPPLICLDNLSNAVTVESTVFGDADLNGTVNGADLNIVLSNFNQSGMSWAQGDFNGDGTINGADLNIVLSNFNQVARATAAVPEPSTLVLLGIGAFSLLGFAWRRRRGRTRCLSCAVVVVAMLIAGSAQADVFNMGGTLNGAVTDATLTGTNRNTGATYFMPSENEWYKAAYDKGESIARVIGPIRRRATTSPATRFPPAGRTRKSGDRHLTTKAFCGVFTCRFGASPLFQRAISLPGSGLRYQSTSARCPRSGLT